MTLYQSRIRCIVNALCKRSIYNVLDMGCGDGKLIKIISDSGQFRKIGGVDKSEKRIAKACRLVEKNSCISFYNQSFLEYNSNFKNYEAIILSEVIEHLQKEEIEKVLDLILLDYLPNVLIITTPNRTYNINFEVLYNGLRHSSHTFELSEDEIHLFVNKLQKKYIKYIFYSDFCTEDHATHLIFAEKR